MGRRKGKKQTNNQTKKTKKNKQTANIQGKALKDL